MTDMIFIRNYLTAQPGSADREAAAELLALTPENRPGKRASFETPMKPRAAAFEARVAKLQSSAVA